MFAQFFGAFLLNKQLVTPEALARAIDEKKNTRMRLGVLAINAGLMTAEQVEHVNVAQQTVDKRFGDLCVEFGYLTQDNVDTLLSESPSDYLLLGQTLVNDNSLTNAQFEDAIKEYKELYQLTDDDISGYQNDKLLGLVKEFYHFNTAENARIYTDYITLLFKNIIRFIGDDFTPQQSTVVKSAEADYVVQQSIVGKYKADVCICAGKSEYVSIAERFSSDVFENSPEFIDAAVGEFLNVINGLFVVNESNESGTELTLEPQVISVNKEIPLESEGFCIPVTFSFGEVVFIVSVH